MEKFDESAARSAGRQRWVRLAYIWGVWTLVGLFFSSQIYFYFIRTEKPVSLARALAWQMPATYVFALSTPLVLWLARRFRVERLNWRKNLLIHFLAGTAFAVVWSVCHILLDSAFNGNIKLALANLPRIVFINLDREMLVYWIIVLSNHAVAYYQRYREGELRASQAQLQALKMQLHPHFLFNALHSISALVHSDPDAADKMIARLGDFLRLTLDASATQEVTLRKELEFLNCYLEIERIRFHDRLTTHIEVDPQTLDCCVPNLILQPIVENAIRHGVAQRSAPGHVEIHAERDALNLRIQVRDNGAGLPSNASHASKGGVGLSNARARLNQLYGAAYRFELENDPRGGCVVTLEIPFRTEAAGTRRSAQLGLDDGQLAPILKRPVHTGGEHAHISSRA
jgi:two-component system, LytTR family, sensor kinase